MSTKHETGVERPSYVKAAWPGTYEMCSWLEYAVTIPYPAFLIATYKDNAKPNACFSSWGLFAGDEEGHCSIVAALKTFHTYENILRSGEWCINLPSGAQQDQCMKTIGHNSLEQDEITESGFTIEPAHVIQAPRIGECLVNMECRLEWDRPLFEGSSWHLFGGRVVHLAMDETAFELEPQKRLQAMQTMYNLRSTLNPLTGEAGPSSLPVL